MIQASSQSAGMAVVLGPVSVADYLQRETFLQRQPDGSLTSATDGRWAGSLSSDIDQLLVRQLAWRLDSQRVVLAPATAGFNPDVQVLLSITRLDSGRTSRRFSTPSGACSIAAARYGITVSFTEQPHEGSEASQVQARGNCCRSWPSSSVLRSNRWLTSRQLLKRPRLNASPPRFKSRRA